MRDRFYLVWSNAAGRPVRPGDTLLLTEDDAIAKAKQLAEQDRAGGYDYYVLQAVKCVHRVQSPVTISPVGED
jgi:hypothetical protein